MLNFRKVHGAGNDFVLLTGTPADLEKDWSDTARDLCARRTGMGADGLVISALLTADPGLRGVACFNADGSIATLCGNALRYAAWCAAQASGAPVKEMRLVMAGVEHQALVGDDGVWVTAEVGAVEPRRVQAVLNGRPVWFDSAVQGFADEVVHAVATGRRFVDEVVCVQGVEPAAGLGER